MNEKNLAIDLMYAWKIGWPEYIQDSKDDHPSIIKIFNYCGSVSKVDLEEESGYMRCKNALASIAAFCRDHNDFMKLNLFKLEIRIQDILIEMSAYKRQKQHESDKQKVNDYYFKDQFQKSENEKLMEKGKLEAKKWVEENWTPELEASYQHDMAIIRAGGNPWEGKGNIFTSKKDLYA